MKNFLLWGQVFIIGINLVRVGFSRDTIYGFGFGKRGQLGVSMDDIKSISLPQATVGLEGIEIVSIDANGDHSAALSGRQLKLLDLRFNHRNQLYF